MKEQLFVFNAVSEVTVLYGTMERVDGLYGQPRREGTVCVCVRVCVRGACVCVCVCVRVCAW